MSPALYYLISIVTLTGGAVSVETKDVKYSSEAVCTATAIRAQPFLEPNQLIRCDIGGPDMPTQMELNAGE